MHFEGIRLSKYVIERKFLNENISPILHNPGYGFKISSANVHISDLKDNKSTFHFLLNPVEYG